MAPPSHSLVGLLPQGDISYDVRSLFLEEKDVVALSELKPEEVAALKPRDLERALVIALLGAVVPALILLVALTTGGGWSLLVVVVGIGVLLASDADSTGGILTGLAAMLGGIGWIVKQVSAERSPVALMALGVAVVGLVASQVAHVAWHRSAVNRHGLERLVPLLADVGRFHRLLSALCVSEQLLAANGATPDARARAEVLRGLRSTREMLLAALRTERVLRRNRALLDQLGSLPAAELGVFEAVRVADVGKEYRVLAEDTVSLAADLEHTLQRMRDGRAS